MTYLKLHNKLVHSQDIKLEKCPHCGSEEKHLKQHIERNHIKVPCSECGLIMGRAYIARHIRIKHTPNDEKKYKCEVCGKGFSERRNFEDHQNTHTGAKPYKCKYCSACFASQGTHGMHQRGHLGQGRNFKKQGIIK